MLGCAYHLNTAVIQTKSGDFAVDYKKQSVCIIIDFVIRCVWMW